MKVLTGRVRAVAAGIAAVALFGVAACGGDEEGGSNGDGQVTLVLQTFGDFGYEAAIQEFERQNPNIKVDHQRMGELRDFAPQLAQWLAAGDGAGDVVGLEEGILLQYIENPDGFLNLFDYGAQELEGVYLDWKWQRGITEDGRLIALGTDVGGLAMCYRADLFEEAGLPSDREEVAELWPTWDDYFEVGKQFMASDVGAPGSTPPTASSSRTSCRTPTSSSTATTASSSATTNPVVREAWDFGLQMADEGLTAKSQRWSDDWDAAFKHSAFATRAVPVLDDRRVIAERSGEEHVGKWDIATIPGDGGNWGGSYLGIRPRPNTRRRPTSWPKFLTSKEGHLLAYEEVGAMPSSLAALEDPRFADTTNEYFSDAPIGKIFADSSEGLEPHPPGCAAPADLGDHRRARDAGGRGGSASLGGSLRSRPSRRRPQLQ